MSEPGTLADREPLYFDDLRVGQRFTSGTYRLDAEQIRVFGRQFDPQPFHVDEVAAQRTFFSGLAASGWHTAAITMRLLVESVSIAGGLIGAGAEINWPRPTRPGDTLHVDTEVLEMRPSRSRPERGMVTIRSETRNERGEVVQTVLSKLVVPRRSPGG